MAKVSGPLFSLEARGKIADAIVYFPWKGVHVVRSWSKPANPQSGDQGDRRVMLGGLGRAPKYIQAASVYYDYALAVAVAPDTWISSIAKYIMATYFTDVAGFDALYTEYNTHPAKQAWHAQAVALGLVAFDLDYKDMTNAFDAGFQLYCLGKYGRDQHLLNNLKFNSSPYDTAIADWVEAEVLELVADFTPV